MGPVTATLAKQEGQLNSDSLPETSWSQPLSDWRLEIIVDGEYLNFKLSAALLATDTLHDWQKRTDNHWQVSDHLKPRLEIAFCVDSATRIAVFGARIPGSTDSSVLDRPQVYETTAADLRLETALVGSSGEIFGYARDGSWIQIFESRSDFQSITLERYRPQRRFLNGFLSVEPTYNWPRVWLTGLDMSRIMDLVLGDRGGSVELKDGCFGHLQGSHQDENPMISIGGVRLDLQLTALGLEFSCNVNPTKSPKLWRFSSESDAWYSNFIIAWEVLILRYTRVAHYRLKTLE